MESDIDLAVAHAIDVARMRGGRLACVTLRGHGLDDVVHRVAGAAFARRGMGAVEVRFQSADGPVMLASVELDHP